MKVNGYSVGLALAAVALAYGSRRRVRGTNLASIQTFTALPNVGIEDLTPGTLDWLRMWATASIQAGIPVTITSGKRDARRQAKAMLAKVDRGEDLHALYRDDEQIADLLNGPRTVERWTETIERYAAMGRGVSNHLSGRAADVRSRDWTPEQLRAAAALATKMGAKRAIIESDHLHIEVGR